MAVEHYMLRKAERLQQLIKEAKRMDIDGWCLREKEWDIGYDFLLAVRITDMPNEHDGVDKEITLYHDGNALGETWYAGNVCKNKFFAQANYTNKYKDFETLMAETFYESFPMCGDKDKDNYPEAN